MAKSKDDPVYEALRVRFARAWGEMPMMGGCTRPFEKGMTLGQMIEINFVNMARMTENAKRVCATLSESENERRKLACQRDAIREFLGLTEQKGKTE